jgi:hypothetical protein
MVTYCQGMLQFRHSRASYVQSDTDILYIAGGESKQETQRSLRYEVCACLGCVSGLAYCQYVFGLAYCQYAFGLGYCQYAFGLAYCQYVFVLAYCQYAFGLAFCQ